MFMHLTIHSITAKHVSDTLFDNCVELYQTWHLSHLDPSKATDHDSCGARLGFSTRGSPDDGVHFRSGETRIVVDPQITIALPDGAFAKGSRTRYAIDYYHWESDGSTGTVRATFSNPTLERLIKAWSAVKTDERETHAKLDSWLKADGERALLEALAAAGAAASPWVPVGMNILPLLEQLMRIAAENGDDFIAADRFVMEINGMGDEKETEWRVIPPGGNPSGWVRGQGKQSFTLPVEDARKRNILDVRYVFRMID